MFISVGNAARNFFPVEESRLIIYKQQPTNMVESFSGILQRIAKDSSGVNNNEMDSERQERVLRGRRFGFHRTNKGVTNERL